MKLNDKRKEIDNIDEQITKLLNKRFLVVKEIKQIKEEENINVLDQNREKQVIDNNKKFINKEFHNQFEVIYKTIMEMSKDIQKA